MRIAQHLNQKWVHIDDLPSLEIENQYSIFCGFKEPPVATPITPIAPPPQLILPSCYCGRVCGTPIGLGRYTHRTGQGDINLQAVFDYQSSDPSSVISIADYIQSHLLNVCPAVQRFMKENGLVEGVLPVISELDAVRPTWPEEDRQPTPRHVFKTRQDRGNSRA
jgi:hypothetical protein